MIDLSASVDPKIDLSALILYLSVDPKIDLSLSTIYLLILYYILGQEVLLLPKTKKKRYIVNCLFKYLAVAKINTR